VEQELFLYFEKQSATIDSLAQEKRWATPPTAALVELLVSLKLVYIESQHVHNTELAKRFLIPGTSSYFGDFFTRNVSLEESYGSLLDTLTSGGAHKAFSERVHESFGLLPGNKAAIQEFAKPMFAASQEVYADLITQLPFDSEATILDIGGGTGALEAVLCSRGHGGMITLLDTPDVIQTARQDMAHHAKYTTFLPTNWHTWNSTDHYDVVVLGHVLHEETFEGAQQLLQKAALATKDGGRVIVISLMSEREENKELSNIFRLNLLLEMGSNLTSIQWLREVSTDLHLAEERIIELVGGRAAWIARKVPI
jgi:2-polyprenyl-3-methyl-5-hydroxy-6-metoxy-1,4-benzoquinol methylase